MSELSRILANLPPEKRSQLLAKLNASSDKGANRKEIDYSGNFEFKFNSETPFDFAAVQTDIPDPEPDCIQIRAKASSLNFRDVMIASKLYPASPGVPTNMGSDYSGIVEKVGKNITGFKKGDEVLSLHAGHLEKGSVRDNCHFIKVFNVHKSCVCHKPKHLTFEEAACVPTVFLTAYIGLVELAKLSESDRVLIHTASGGVGLTALQIARWKGSEIYATAGTPEKRQFLSDAGIENVYDSRSPEFAREIESKKVTMDVVMNTLSGDLMMKSVSLLGPFGRFIHIDKKDIAENTSFPLGLLKNGISFQFLDISLLFRNPELLNRSLRNIVDLFDKKELKPIHYNAFPVNELKKAINTLSRSKHIGKIVVNYDING